jgi:hypothetical protein
MKSGRRLLLLDGGRPSSQYALPNPSSDELAQLELETDPIAGRDGYRRDRLTGEVWYSTEWLGKR